MKETNNRIIFWFTLASIIMGVLLRIASFSWNNALNGDVNLFALTAREFALHGKLEYPMKYDYSPWVAYQTLHTPASQHPPLWSVIAGIIAKNLHSDDTFSILKILSEVCGVLLIGSMLCFGKNFQVLEPFFQYLLFPPTLFIACSLVSLSAVLIDFSANGSPYILMALWITLDTWLLVNFDPQNFLQIFLAGIFCALGILTHSALLFLPLGFAAVLLFKKPCNSSQTFKLKPHIIYLLIFVIITFVILLPWLVWNSRHFGQPFYSYSSYYLWERLGLLRTEISNGIIVSQLDISLPVNQILQRYILIAGKSFYALCREFFLVAGPFTIILFGYGIYIQGKENKEKLAYLLLPSACYIIAILVWATYKFRFLIPLLPVFFLLSAAGFTTMRQRGKIWQWIAGICLTGTLIWIALPSSREVKTLYYGEESQSHAVLYSAMKPLASWLASMPEGVVLGYAQPLDGGIETIYWHHLPFVAGRGLGEAEIKKLAKDFNIRYIWADTITRDTIEEWLPEVKILKQSGEFTILEMPIEP